MALMEGRYGLVPPVWGLSWNEYGTLEHALALLGAMQGLAHRWNLDVLMLKEFRLDNLYDARIFVDALNVAGVMYAWYPLKRAKNNKYNSAPLVQGWGPFGRLTQWGRMYRDA